MKHLLWVLAFALGLSAHLSSAHAGACLDPSSIKTSAVANVGAATTVAITPAANAITRMFICHIAGSLAGTTPSITLIYGSGTNCGTGAVTLSGAILPITGSYLELGYGDDLVVIPPSNQLCATTTGTGSSFQGIVTLVQK